MKYRVAAIALAVFVTRGAAAQEAMQSPAGSAQAPAPSTGSGANDLSLEDVLRSVDRSFPLIAAAAREEDEARGNYLSAQGGFDPSLKGYGTIEPVGGYPKQYGVITAEQPTALWGSTFFGGYRYGGGKIPIYEQKLETNDYGELRGGVRVPLWRDGPIDKRRAARSQAELGVSLAKLGVDQQRIEARRIAALRYWDWVVAGQKLTILRAWLSLARDRDTGLATRAERGDIPEIDRTENQRTILQRQTAVIAAERDLAQAGMELSLFWRDDGGQPLIPSLNRLPSALPQTDGVDIPNERVAEKTALERRPDLKRFDLVRERNRIEADLARNQQAPAVDVTLYGSDQFGPGDALRGQPVLGASLMLDIPILNRVQRGKEDSAEAVVARTNEQKRMARDRIIADIRASLVTIEAARDRAFVAKREVEVATGLATAELRRFELGEGNLLLVNLREQATAEASMREVEARADFQRAVANFRAATARDLK